MAKNEVEGLVILLDVGASMSNRAGVPGSSNSNSNSTSSCLQLCADIVQMIVQRKMFQASKDELALVLFGTSGTDNELWRDDAGRSDAYRHVTLARPLSVADWQLLDYVQNQLAASSTLRGDIVDGLTVAVRHFDADINAHKHFREKRVMVLTDFACGVESSTPKAMHKLRNLLLDNQIRVDVISPFDNDDGNEEDEEDKDDDRNESADNTNGHGKEKSKSHGNNGDASSADNADNAAAKPLSAEQTLVRTLLRRICGTTDGALFSFGEALALLGTFQARAIRSTGTKYTLTVGESLRMPIVSQIRCKESKPDLFRFKQVYARDESVQLKTDRTRITKDDEQRPLDDREDLVDAYRYGATYVPVDNADALRLSVEKCFSLLGFTKQEHVRRHYYLGDALNQIVPDLAAAGGADSDGGAQLEAAFAGMVRAMYAEDVCGLVRRVYSCRSSPELGALIPHIAADTTCLFYVTLPFDDDVRRFALDNFAAARKWRPSEHQLQLVDELIDSMLLSGVNANASADGNDAGNDTTATVSGGADTLELYDPHVVFNPYIQRMFQSIAWRATNPSAELPDFASHITSTQLAAQADERARSHGAPHVLKRCAEAFPLRVDAKKLKKSDASNMFDLTPHAQSNSANSGHDAASIVDGEKSGHSGGSAAAAAVDGAPHVADFDMSELMSRAEADSSVRRVGTLNPVGDFRYLADKLLQRKQKREATATATAAAATATATATDSDAIDEFDELCMQMQTLVREFFEESLRELSSSSDSAAHAFQLKAQECIRVQRDYALRFDAPRSFNSFLEMFKAYLLSETRKRRAQPAASKQASAESVERFWQDMLVSGRLTLIGTHECAASDVSSAQAESFLDSFGSALDSVTVELKDESKKEEVEDLLDLM